MTFISGWIIISTVMRLAQATDKIHSAEASKFLRALPAHCVDLIMTSPPYWQPHAFASTRLLGGEMSCREYVDNLMLLSLELQRIIKPRAATTS